MKRPVRAGVDVMTEHSVDSVGDLTCLGQAGERAHVYELARERVRGDSPKLGE